MSSYWRLSPLAVITPVALVLLATLTTFVFYVPAGLMAQALQRYYPKITIQTTRGSLWKGQGHLHYNNEYAGILNWNVEWLSLVALSPKASFHLEKYTNPGRSDLVYDIHGQADLIIPDAILISDLQAEFDLAPLTSLSGNSSVKLDGDLIVSEGVVQWDIEPSGRVLWHIPAFAKARLDWPGGQATLTLGGREFSSVLPALTGRLSGLGDLKLRIGRSGQETPLITMSLTSQGILLSNVHYALVVLMGGANIGLIPPEKVLYQSRWDMSRFLSY